MHVPGESLSQDILIVTILEADLGQITPLQPARVLIDVDLEAHLPEAPTALERVPRLASHAHEDGRLPIGPEPTRELDAKGLIILDRAPITRCQRQVEIEHALWVEHPRPPLITNALNRTLRDRLSGEQEQTDQDKMNSSHDMPILRDDPSIVGRKLQERCDSIQG
jgi:hypothetical protein